MSAFTRVGSAPCVTLVQPLGGKDTPLEAAPAVPCSQSVQPVYLFLINSYLEKEHRWVCVFFVFLERSVSGSGLHVTPKWLKPAPAVGCSGVTKVALAKRLHCPPG